MPVARGPQINARSAIVGGITGVVIALLLGVGVVWLANSGSSVKIQIGDTDFDAGSYRAIAGEIADNGSLLYSDVGGGRRDIRLNHLGDDPASGWYAFDARPADQPRACFFDWDDSRGLFALNSADDSITCSDTTVDATGLGVTQYPVTIDDNGSLRVDINLISQNQQNGQGQ